ncbi:MAG: hypothetical protein JW966_02505 [Anaerolineae bacterium]|nr:hypothetical protein [Anaerolineae bacterium]
MTSSHDIRTTQQLANAAEAFVLALRSLFPAGTFDQFFHGDTLHRAYWTALQETLDRYVTPENIPFAKALMDGHVLSDSHVVAELLKLFLPGQRPDYGTVAAYWAQALNAGSAEQKRLAQEAEQLFTVLTGVLNQSPDLRMALQQAAEVHFGLPADAVFAADDDLDRLLDAALSAGPGDLSRQVRHLLALGTKTDPEMGDHSSGLLGLANLVDHLPKDALKTLWDRTIRADDPALRVRVTGWIAPRLYALDLIADPLALVVEEIEDGGAALDPALCADVLLRLTPHLTTPGGEHTHGGLRERLLDAVQEIDDPASRVRVLGVLVGKLPYQHQREAVALAFEAATRGISNEQSRARALADLPPHLPAEFRIDLLEIARSLKVPEARALLLERLIPYVHANLREQVVLDVLDAIEQIGADDARAEALAGLAPAIDAVGSLQHVPEALERVITVIFTITSDDARARTFAELAPHLSPELLSEAMQAIKGMTDDHDRAATLSRLAPHLSDDLSVAALTVAREIQPNAARSSALAALSPYVSAAARARILGEALAAALAIETRYERVLALVDLAPYLPDDLRWRAMHESLTAARSIPDESERGHALIFLAPHVPSEMLADALADAYTIGDPMGRVSVLSALMPRLPDEPRARVAWDVISTAANADSMQNKTDILASVARVLPGNLVGDVLDVLAVIDSPYNQSHVLAALLPRQPDRLYDAALKAARAVLDDARRTNALLEIASHTPAGERYAILVEALDAALGVHDDYDRAGALAQVALFMDTQHDVQNRRQDALALVVQMCCDVPDPGTRAALLSRLAAEWVRLLTPPQSYTLWRQVVGCFRERPYHEVVTALAALSPVIEHMGAPDVAHELANTLFGA